MVVMWLFLYCVVTVASTVHGNELTIAGLGTKDLGTICQNTFHHQSLVPDSKPPQQDKSPFEVVTNVTKYIPGQPLQVSIIGPGHLRGVILQARHPGSSTVVGEFVVPLGGAHSILNCSSINDTVVTWDGSPAANVTYSWRSPDDLVGTIHFVATVFKDGDVYWENITSRRLRKGFAPIDVRQCGKEKGCFRYISGSSDCDGTTCDYLVTYQEEGNVANFELSAKADWVAVGFSSDDRMGGDDVLMCVRMRHGAEVHHYFTNYKYSPPSLMANNPLFKRQVEVTADGRISCRFSRPMKVDNDQFSVDLNNDWWQLYSWGYISSGGAIMRHTLETPPASQFKITLSPRRNVISSANPLSAVFYIYSIGLFCVFVVLRGDFPT